eukprot:gnl/TRDRNA2_/TRDRNA2_174569_c0_seq4.p1 gnl/TRDRNA2_/TRDRNA2_174569_c0~~gnl/TRDRNA2_/TRDRNA2_174569_c0_seq4.p1  ORF type:complete len:269 (-),score=48.10 gnl/TRDRNA2_/TRDRNA2_174569_c0_seq4:52-858(-)
MEFTKYGTAHQDGGMTGNVVIQSFALFMPNAFSRCQDQKMCLQQLSDPSGTRLSTRLSLRNDNRFQLRCLKNWQKRFSPDQKGVCNNWVECLRKGGHEQEVLNILEAATDFKTSEQQDKKCIYPPTADPESWHCDCYNEMKCRCAKIRELHGFSGFSEKACLRSSFCLHPDVCQGWKDSACNTDDVKNLQMALNAISKGEACTETDTSLLQFHSAADADKLAHIDGEYQDTDDEDTLQAWKMLQRQQHVVAGRLNATVDSSAASKRCK